MTHEEEVLLDYFIGKTANKIITKSDIPVFSLIPWKNVEESIFTKFVDPLGVIK